MLRLAVTARGLNKLVIAKPQNLRMAQAMYMNQNTLVSAQMRSFAKKKKGGKKSAEATTTDDEVDAEAVQEEVIEEVVEEVVQEVVPEPTPEPVQPTADFSAAT